MALIKCANCGKEISDKSSKCIHCGTTNYLKDEKITYSEDENVTIKDLKHELEKKKIHKEKQNNFIILIDIIRYLIALFFSFGGFVSLIVGKVLIGIGYLFIGIPFYPFIYKKIFKTKEISNTTEMICQIVAIIIGFIVGIILIIGGAK